MSFPKPKTLKEHLEQEIFVASQIESKDDFEKIGFDILDKFYRENEHTENYHIIFNFFYGDNASASLEFPIYGIVKKFTGFDYAKGMANYKKDD